MKTRYLRLGALVATIALLLAACGGEVNDNPEAGSIEGVLFSAPDTWLNNASISLCAGGSGCSTNSDVLASISGVGSGHISADFKFTDVPAGTYDLVASMTDASGSYRAELNFVSSGTSGNALFLSAVGTNPDPEPDPEPETDRIYGTLYAPYGATQQNAWIYLCEDGSGCQYEEDVLVEIPSIDTGTSSQGYYFYNLPDSHYDLFAYMNDGASESFAWLDHVSTGSVGNDLRLQTETPDPTDGTATMTGMLYLPGTGGMSALANGASIRARAADLGGSMSATAIPADELYLSAHNDLGTDRELTAVPGELVVQFRDDVIFSQASLGTMSVDGVQLQHVQDGMNGQHLYRAAELDENSTIALAEQLQQRGDIERAAPNWVLPASPPRMTRSIRSSGTTTQ